ncbi:MAG: energy transducer TonB [Candidatus Brocadia sp.]
MIVVLGAVGFTLIFFFVLPLIQSISRPPVTDLMVQNVNTASIPPPPPPEEKPEDKPEPEEPPPELKEEISPLDLSQLELALDPGFSEGWVSGDFAVNLKTIDSNAERDNLDALFSLADLDQKPRVIYQPGPILDKQMRKKAPGTVYILFVVDQNGRVEKPMVQSSSDPVFEKPALDAVKQWKFEPGKRHGRPVRFRMRVPISFPKG